MGLGWLARRAFRLVALPIAVAIAAPAGAEVFNVTLCTDTPPGGAPGELRKAITDAGDFDVIDLPACRIPLSGAPGEDANVSGDLDVAKRIIIRGAGRGLSIVDGNGVDRVFHVTAGVVSLANLTIQGGKTGDPGAGLLAEGANTLVDLTDTEVVDNDATVSLGGGIAAAPGARITVRRSLVARNKASSGGGLAAGGAALIILDSTVTDNEADGGGGVITLLGLAHIEQSTISGNRATSGLGGGISAGGKVTVLSSTVADNTASASGGGIAGSLQVFVGSSIIARNLPDDCSGPMLSTGHNLQSDGSCPFAEATDVANSSPGLGPLADNGGPTRTHALLPGSPAIDAGATLGCPRADQRGVPRPQGGVPPAPACDIGAFERRPPGAGREGAPVFKPVDPR